MKSQLIIIMLGRPGSGKGTQAKLLAEKLKLAYFGSGESLRERSKKTDFTGKKIAKILSAGELVPSVLIAKIWMNRLEELYETGIKGLVADGTPRKVREAEYFNELLNWYDWMKNLKVILIDISAKASFDRLMKRRQCKSCKEIIPYIGEFKNLKSCPKCEGELIVRADDNPRAIKERLNVFKSEVIPVVKLYGKLGKLIKINGEQSIENVFKDILKAVK